MNDIEHDLQIFSVAATKHAEATENGDYQTANKQYEIITSIIATLTKTNGINRLSELLNSDTVGVRMWAAFYLLSESETKAMNILTQIAAGDGIHSLTAQTIVDEWIKKHNHISKGKRLTAFLINMFSPFYK